MNEEDKEAFYMRSSMSLASVHPAEIHSSHSSLMTFSHSLDDLATLGVHWPSTEHLVTIEQLRLEMTTCFTCGVSWNDSHVSLDCSECGGYALDRPCLECEGKCGAMWKRDLSLSHSSGKARWQGECALSKSQNNTNKALESDENTTSTITEQEITKRLAKLSANS
ncbi:protein pinocchio isoform X2 [Harmonia axyridis]|uniref:protein pinocchio isoform X2 n=1 Tax=Harmonia axyridis TaxID=115357 RepID=UPI001E27695C|nr:protein pinocchio isoform X2 [Harmonia axyridis]